MGSIDSNGPTPVATYCTMLSNRGSAVARYSVLLQITCVLPQKGHRELSLKVDGKFIQYAPSVFCLQSSVSSKSCFQTLMGIIDGNACSTTGLAQQLLKEKVKTLADEVSSPPPPNCALSDPCTISICQLDKPQ